jgi:ABC-type branched-subunit amino acid transport system substrate-binding protein
VTSPLLRVGALLSLTGRFARFGRQAAAGLDAWARLTDRVEIVVEDDESDKNRVRSSIVGLSRRCDLLLGPYSTLLMRATAEVVPDLGTLVWNHGGSGDDVQAAAPGHLVSVLTPTSRYADSFVRLLAGLPTRRPLALAQGRGSFARQVVAGAQAAAEREGLPTIRLDNDSHPNEPFDLFSAGTFEDDVALVTAALGWGRRPRTVGSVAAGVREFGEVVAAPDGVFGVAQWFPGRTTAVDIGPTEEEFLAAYRGGTPDYPAVQAVAAAALAVHCAVGAGSTSRVDVWSAAADTTATTLFGDFSVDRTTGAQLGHQMALVRWRKGQPHVHSRRESA